MIFCSQHNDLHIYRIFAFSVLKTVFLYKISFQNDTFYPFLVCECAQNSAIMAEFYTQTEGVTGGGQGTSGGVSSTYMASISAA